jgi:YD repeat-containing protein
MKRAKMSLWQAVCVALSLGCAAFSSSVAYAQTPLAPPQIYRMSPTGINMADGRFAYSNTDLSVGPLALERSNLTGLRIVASQYFGPDWTHNYDIYTIANCPATTPCMSVVIGRTTYKFDRFGSTGSYQFIGWNSASGTSLQFDGTNYLFIDRDGTRYQFLQASGSGAAGQRASTISYTDGRRISITYDTSKRPKVVSSNQGYAIVFDYESHGWVSAACGFNTTVTAVNTLSTCSGATLKTGYTYGLLNGETRLTGFQNVLNQTSSIGAEGGCIIWLPSGLCRVALQYGGLGIQQTMGDGRVWNYMVFGEIGGGGDGVESITMIDPNGGTLKYAPIDEISTGRHYYTITDQNNRLTRVDTAGDMDSLITMPEGNKVQLLYSPRNAQFGGTYIPKSASGLSPITQGAGTFPVPNATPALGVPCDNPATCNKPLTVTDGNGNVTTYTYDQTHGGVLTATGPAVGGIQPQTRYAYVQRYAWVSNGAGGYVHDVAPIWLVSETRMCKTSATVSGGCAAGSTDEVVTSYDYGPDSGPSNLLLRGQAVTADGVTLRTCFGYDGQGNKISQTTPRAGLATCS